MSRCSFAKRGRPHGPGVHIVFEGTGENRTAKLACSECAAAVKRGVDPRLADQDKARETSGRYGHALDRLCECGHIKHQHTVGSRRAGAVWGDCAVDGCLCEKFKAARARKNPRKSRRSRRRVSRRSRRRVSRRSRR